MTGSSHRLTDRSPWVSTAATYGRRTNRASFEVIAGRSVVAFRRDADENVPEAKCFGYVQTYDRKPRDSRLWEMLKSQGLQDNQQVVFLSDGGEDVRGVQAYLQPGSEHWIDWFHITMRLTVLQQQTKSLRCEVGWDAVAEGISKQIESIKHLLWHGNVCEALERQCRAADALGVLPRSFGGGREVNRRLE